MKTTTAMNPKIRSYLQAGARLTDCRSSATVTNQHDLVTPDGERYVSTPDGGAVLWRSGGWAPTSFTFEQLLWRWQPDLSGSASSQHFIDTGHYLPVVADQAEHPASLVHDDRGLEVAVWPAHPDMAEDGGPEAIVVQVDTGDVTGRIRVNLNDAPIWDGDPRTDSTPGAHFDPR